MGIFEILNLLDIVPPNWKQTKRRERREFLEERKEVVVEGEKLSLTQYEEQAIRVEITDLEAEYNFLLKYMASHRDLGYDSKGEDKKAIARKIASLKRIIQIKREALREEEAVKAAEERLIALHRQAVAALKEFKIPKEHR